MPLPNSTERVERLSPATEQLSELARTQLGNLSAAQQSAGWRRMQGALNRGSWRLHLTLPRALLVTAAILALGFGVGRLALRSSAALTYELDGTRSTASGDVPVSERTRLLRFSDGSEISMQPGAKLRVRALSEHGAHLSLASGTLALNVRHLPQADWSVNAGPFLIQVTGTSFAAEWNPESAQLRVKLDHGSVEVSGPLSDEAIRLRAGQQLFIRLREREVVIRDIDQPAPTVNAPIAGVTPEKIEPAQPTPEASAKMSSRPQLSWSAQLAAGKFDAILEDAASRGIDQVLRTSASDDVAALADAARFRRQNTLARRALLAQRQRFSGSTRARDAAFLLGRLEEASGAATQAASWYERYLAEASGGTYASEALGRKMLLMQNAGRRDDSLVAAHEYLRRFPAGSYAQAARTLSEKP